jgi:hypothetical protein
MPSELFTVEEALARLGQKKDQGCLLVTKGSELIHIFVQDGFVIRADSAVREGKEAVDQALRLSDAIYTWLRGVQPPSTGKNIHLNIREFASRQPPELKPKMGQTNRLNGVEKKEPEAQFHYFLVPQDRLREKLYLNKTSSVMGRDPASDLPVENSDVSWRHCLLDIQARGVFILDLDSTNGTYVNGILVRDGYLNPGDRIELGPAKFIINRESIDAL